MLSPTEQTGAPPVDLAGHLVEYCKPKLKQWLDEGTQRVVVYVNKDGLAFIERYRSTVHYASERFLWSTHGYTPRIVFDTNYHEAYSEAHQDLV